MLQGMKEPYRKGKQVLVVTYADLSDRWSTFESSWLHAQLSPRRNVNCRNLSPSVKNRGGVRPREAEVGFWEVKIHGNLETLSSACSRRCWPSTPRASGRTGWGVTPAKGLPWAQPKTRPAPLSKRREVQNSKTPLFHLALKSPKLPGIPTFPPLRRLLPKTYNRTFHF